ncbi:MAG: MBL fold metallo-hydrolase [Phycisphaerales bacterium]
MRFTITRSVLTLSLLIAGAMPAVADVGKPVAVRWWGQSFVTIETYWNLHIAIDPYSMEIGYDDPGVSAHLVLLTHDHADHANAPLIKGDPTVVRGLDENGSVRSVDLVLDRMPNEPDPVVLAAGDRRSKSPHAVRLRTISSFHDHQNGDLRGQNAIVVVEIDGVRIAHLGDFGQNELSEPQTKALTGVDVLLIPVGGVYTIDGATAARITAEIGPRFVVPIHFKTDSLTIELETDDAFLAALPDRFRQVDAVGNTLAVSALRPEVREQPAVVRLRPRPWEMSAEMKDLFARKETAARATQSVFAPLSARQMNHRPSDGTHSPRWNVEHMMGRELGFFSSIYSNLESQIPMLDLNPRQMPEDYEPAHRDWTGAEEARQIERVQAFTRRFAYLLDGIDLESKPEGSPWKLRPLLRQMERHYGEHTANVKRKFELPDWPAESGERQ